jgi:putative SOS response-associated peptidase YedK
MCGRFTLGATATDLAAQFNLATVPPWTPRYNIAPTQEVLIVRQPAPQASGEARLHRWGLVPSWANDPTIGNRLINARAETVATKPAFRLAFKERRCLVLADGFYEWHKEGTRKQPYHLRLRDGRPFAFAGLWEHWEGEETAIDSCTLITTTVVRKYSVQPPNFLFILVLSQRTQSNSQGQTLDGKCPRTVGSPWGHHPPPRKHQ